MSAQPLIALLTAMADDELILGHRASEWTGHAPILEEDIAFSNIAQDEIGHSLVWYSLLETITGRTPDDMGFRRPWSEFRCCRCVSYRNGDFAHAVVRQYLFDEAERLRLQALTSGSNDAVAEAARRILPEEKYHLLHVKSLVERLGDGTEESHRRMQAAVDRVFPQALGLFEAVDGDADLVAGKVYPGGAILQAEWVAVVAPFLRSASLHVPVRDDGSLACEPDLGGRRGDHVRDLEDAVRDLQSVFQSEPDASW